MVDSGAHLEVRVSSDRDQRARAQGLAILEAREDRPMTMHDAIEDAVREYFNERKMVDEKNSNVELSNREIACWLGGALIVIALLGAIVWKVWP
jgi:hypothetical protein